jgi:hypothetical protein
VAERIKGKIESSDQGAVERFESLLFASGFDWQQDYSAYRWVAGPSQQFRVEAGFPRLVGSDAPTGVSNVRYSISLIECERFAINSQELDASLTGAASAD